MIKITALKQFRDKTIGLYIDDYPTTQSEKCRTVTKLVFRERKIFENDEMPAPITLDQTAAQVLVDNLWDCGIRPTEGLGSAGSFAAQSKHLEDMRKLVFEHVVIKKGQSMNIVEDQENLENKIC